MSNWNKKNQKPKEPFYPLDMSGFTVNLNLEGREVDLVAEALGVLAQKEMDEQNKIGNSSRLEISYSKTRRKRIEWLVEKSKELQIKYTLERNKRIMEGKGHPDDIIMPIAVLNVDGTCQLCHLLPEGFTMEDYKKHSSDKLKP